jgi:hypothetical protein
VDSEDTGGLQRLEEVSNYTTHPASPGTPHKLAAVHISYKQCGQYGNRHRTRGVRHQSQDLVPGLFHK